MNGKASVDRVYVVGVAQAQVLALPAVVADAAKFRNSGQADIAGESECPFVAVRVDQRRRRDGLSLKAQPDFATSRTRISAIGATYIGRGFELCRVGDDSLLPKALAIFQRSLSCASAVLHIASVTAAATPATAKPLSIFV